MIKPKSHTGARAFASLLLVVTLLAPLGVFAQGRRRGGTGRGAPAFAALAWPRVTSQAKPWTRWWWLGSAVNRRDLSAALAQYEKAGLGGLELTPIYGVRGEERRFINFLSPEWVGMLEHTIKEANRLGLGVDMATGTGWPFGGPWVDAEDACKDLLSKTWELRGGARLGEPVRFIQKPFVRAVGRRPDIATLREPVSMNPNLQELALDQVRFEKPLPLQALMASSDRGETIDLTARVRPDGTLDWVAPPGRWKLYGVFQGWHGKLVERAAPGGEGNVIDHFSAEALGHYLAKFDRAFAGRNVRGLRAFFNDSYEVDDAEGQSDWTPMLFAEFRARRGYDLREQLPALLGDGDAEKRARVLHDFRETISDLLLERFTAPWREWAHKKGAIVRNQSHGSPANILDLYAASDIPETEGTDIVRMKFASSAANVTGKTLAAAETVTWLDEHFLSSLGDVKRAVDLNFLGGINHVVYHGLAFSPPADPWPGWLFYAAVHLEPTNPQWKDFPTLNRYVARVQSFLQQGRADNDVLLYYPVHDMWMEPGKERLIHVGGGHDVGITQGDAQALLDAGYAFDLVSDRQLLKNVTYSQVALSAGGKHYDGVIVLPETRFIPLETFEKLTALARQGATVVVRKSLPSDVPGLHNLDARRGALRRLTSQLNFSDTHTSGVRSASVGAGRFLLGDDLTKLLAHANVRREAMVERGLRFTRRRDAGGGLYFILNRGAAPFEGWVPLATGGSAAAVFDALTGEAGRTQLRNAPGGGQEIYLQLAPGESCVVRMFNRRPRGAPFPYFRPAGAAQPLEGGWQVQFVEGGPRLPPELSLNDLTSWLRLDGDAYKSFSGTARYTMGFDQPQGHSGDWLLDLGRVAESARVRLNGRDLGTLITPPFRVRVPAALLRGRNALEVEVSNLPLNRVIELERSGGRYKKFYNTNFPARRPENRGADGLFDATKLAPRDSGLLGPVTLTPVEPVRF